MAAANPIGFVSSPGWDAAGGVPAIWNGFTDLITSVPYSPSIVGTHGNLLVRWESAEAALIHVTGTYFQDDRNPPPTRIMGYVLEKNGVQLDAQSVSASSTPMDQPPVFPDSFAAPMMRVAVGLST